MRLRRLAGGLFAVGLLASVSAFPATAGTLVAPAASIAGPNGRFVGGAVHNDTGAGQTVAFVIPSGSDRHGYVRIRNNGSSTQTFLLHGPAGRGPFRLRYATFEDVTAEVVRGTFSMTLARGDSGYVEFTAGAAPDSRAGQSEAFRFRATNRDDPILFDVVRTKIAVGPVSSWAVNFRGTLRCNASVPSATLHPGYDTHAVLTLTNLTDRAVRPHIGFGYLEFFDGSGHKLWDSAPRFEGPRPTVGEVGPHETVPLYVYDTRVRWSGPLLVRPVCQGLDAKVPGLPMRVAAPGAPATLADAIDAAVGLPNSPFQACHPGPGGEPATGEFPAPDGRPIPPASLRCWADVRQEDGFDVVALNMVSPSDGPDYTIDESSFVFGPPQLPGDQSFLAARWSFVVTTEQVRPYISIMFDKTFAPGKAFGYQWHDGGWTGGGGGRCDYESAALAFVGTYFFLDFVNGCTGTDQSGEPGSVRITVAEPGRPPATIERPTSR